MEAWQRRITPAWSGWWPWPLRRPMARLMVDSSDSPGTPKTSQVWRHIGIKGDSPIVVDLAVPLVIAV